MQNLFHTIESSNDPQLLIPDQIFINPDDMKSKDPAFYDNLAKKGIEIKPESFPFSIKSGGEGKLFDKDNLIIITSAEELLRQHYGIEAGSVNVGGHGAEISRDWQKVIDEPGKYIMLTTNGCQLPRHQLNLLLEIFHGAILATGFGHPETPETIISQLKALPSASIAEYGNTTDHNGNPLLTAVLIFEKAQVNNKKINEAFFPPNISLSLNFPQELIPLINSSVVLKKALYEYSAGILSLIHDNFIADLQKYSNLQKYLTEDEINNWEMLDMIDLIDNGNLMERVHEALNTARRPFTRDCLGSVYRLYSSIAPLYGQLLNNPENTLDEVLLKQLLISVYHLGNVKSAVRSTHEMAGMIKPEVEREIESRLNRLVNEFRNAALPEFARLLSTNENTIISPLYQHYKQFAAERQAVIPKDPTKIREAGKKFTKEQKSHPTLNSVNTSTNPENASSLKNFTGTLRNSGNNIVNTPVVAGVMESMNNSQENNNSITIGGRRLTAATGRNFPNNNPSTAANPNASSFTGSI